MKRLWALAALLAGCSPSPGDPGARSSAPLSTTPATTGSIRATATATAATTTAPPQASATASATASTEPRPPAPPPGAKTRVAHLNATCAPWDGAAIELDIDDLAACATTPHAFIAISVWKAPPLAPGTTLRLSNVSQEGNARRCAAGAERCEPIQSTVLTIETSDDKTMTGYYTLTFADGSVLEERFTATWCERRARCG